SNNRKRRANDLGKLGQHIAAGILPAAMRPCSLNIHYQFLGGMQMDNIKSVENALSGLLLGFHIHNQKNSFGNQILYDMCDPNKNPWGDAARLADKIWLIGRSYAASPERRYYRKKNESG